MVFAVEVQDEALNELAKALGYLPQLPGNKANPQTATAFIQHRLESYLLDQHAELKARQAEQAAKQSPIVTRKQ